MMETETLSEEVETVNREPNPPTPYQAWVNEFTRYLDSLPGGPRRAWQEAAYTTYVADKQSSA
jgi:hypothetical protein